MCELDIKPAEFWEMTPAEISAMYDRKRRADERNWDHTAQILYSLIAPHMKKGSSIQPSDFHPYRRTARRLLTRDEIDTVVQTEAFKKGQERAREKFKMTGRKSVWDKLKEKRNGHQG